MYALSGGWIENKHTERSFVFRRLAAVVSEKFLT